MMENILSETKTVLHQLCEAEGGATEKACDLEAIRTGEEKIKQAEEATAAVQAALASIKGGEDDPVTRIMQVVLVEKIGIPIEEWFEEDGSLKAEVVEQLDAMANDDSWNAIASVLEASFKDKGTNLEEYFGAAKWIASAGSAGSFITAVYRFFTETRLPSLGFKGIDVGYDTLNKVDFRSLTGWKDLLTGETTQNLLPSIEGGEIFLVDPETGERVQQISDLIGGTGWFQASVYLGIAAACFFGLQKLFAGLRPIIDRFKKSPGGKWAAKKVSLSAVWIKTKIGEGIIAATPHVKKAAIYLRDKALKYIKIGWVKLKQSCKELSSKAIASLQPRSALKPGDKDKMQEYSNIPTIEEIRSMKMWLLYIKEYKT